MDLKGNLSTEHQLPGDAKRPDAATLDKNRTPEGEDSDRGGRPFIADNGEVRGSGAGAGGGDLTRAPAHLNREDQLEKAVENQSSVTPDDYPEKNSMTHADKG